jgi:hypothetical protein
MFIVTSAETRERRKQLVHQGLDGVVHCSKWRRRRVQESDSKRSMLLDAVCEALWHAYNAWPYMSVSWSVELVRVFRTVIYGSYAKE